VHYAVYRFADLAAADAALNAESFKALVADFDRSWPSGVTRTRDVVSQVEEQGASRVSTTCGESRSIEGRLSGRHA